jgi:integrase/recombinase XerD
MQEYLKKMQLDMELRNMAKSTIASYIKRVEVFLRDTSKAVNEIIPEDIRNYVIQLLKVRKLSAGTINQYITAIKFFYDITLEKAWDNRKVPYLRGYKSLPAVLSKEEVLEVINSIKNLKHKAILMIMYGSGLRVGEVARLKVKDIDSKNFQIFIPKSKNGSDRYAILSKTNLEFLRTYWLKCGKPKEWLFPGSIPDEHINVKSIKNLVLKIKIKLGITKKISAHTFRHAFATHLLEDGVQLTHIQQLLGHNCLQSTSKYTHMTSKAMMNIKSPLDFHEVT